MWIADCATAHCRQLMHAWLCLYPEMVEYSTVCARTKLFFLLANCGGNLPFVQSQVRNRIKAVEFINHIFLTLKFELLIYCAGMLLQWWVHCIW